MSKRSIDKRVGAIEKVQSDGIDWLATEIRNLYSNEQLLADAMETNDTTVAAIRALLVEKGILTDSEIDRKREELDKMRAQAIEAQAQQRELRQIDDAAKAADTEGHPEEAFIFGG
tara:strand:+ start:114 stop:461 length:348 start_codon:yes stop_codon:yes gene_type:complete